MMTSISATTRSRQYSKGGCRECKRRKIKCDEGKPACYQCHRLDKQCSYPLPGEKVPRVSKRPKSKTTDVPFTVLQFETTKLNELASIATSLPNVTSQKLGSLDQYRESTGLFRITPSCISSHSEDMSTASENTSSSMIHHENTNINDQFNSLEPDQAKLPLTINNKTNNNNINDNKNSNNNNSTDVVFKYNTNDNNNNNTDNNNKNNNNNDNNGVIFTNNPNSNINIGQNENNKHIHKLDGSSIQNNYAPLSTQQNNNGISMNHDINTIINPLNSFEANSFTYLHDEFDLFDQHDLDTLADDLQRFVKATMSHSGDIPGPDSLQPVDNNQNQENTTSFAKQEPGANNPSLKATNKKQQAIIPINIPLDYIKIDNRQEKFYLEEFYNDFSIIIFPLCAYDSETDSFYNPARDVLLFYATDEPVLLSAILAQGAITSFKKHKLQGDEESYDKYLSRCLELIDSAIKGYSSDIISNIEIVLLTVLLLTSANASSANQNWRPHLKGAKDLILRSNIAMSNANKGQKKVVHSNLLICCKYWFIAFELLASVTTKLGGTLSLDEIDLLMTRGTDHEVEVMKSMGFITPEGYNLLGGYHNDAIIHYRDLIKYLERCRLNQTIDYQDTLSKMELLSRFQSLLKIEYYSTSGVVAARGVSQDVISRKLLDPIQIDGQECLLSWLDIYHQTYTLSAMISILTKFMDVSYESNTVQSLNNQIINTIRFLLRPSIADIKNHSNLLRSSLLMLQWPMLVASSCCFNEDDQFLLMKFFRIIGQLGSASAGMVLTRLYSVWERKSKKSVTQPDEDFDIVLY
jgi:hypothetical protein